MYGKWAEFWGRPGLGQSSPGAAQGAPGKLREAQGRLRDAPGAPGKPQEQLRNEPREFQENRVFRPWEASGGPRETQNRWGGLAGAKGKARVIPGHPKEEGF